MIQLELPESDWLKMKERVAIMDDDECLVVPCHALAKLLRDHTKLVERLKSEIDWAQVLML
jgi:hypothetical protein